METLIDFVLARYNYWIVIILMMTGLYTVFSRGNLVKKIVGLNLFQTSVFIFYITIGKIAGGTAPIYIGDDLKKMNDAAHGDHGGGDHGEDHHGEAGHGDGGHEGDNHEAALHGDQGSHDVNLTHDGALALEDSLHAKVENVAVNDLQSAAGALPSADNDAVFHAGSLHETASTGDKIANTHLASLKNAAEDDPAADTIMFDAEDSAHGAAQDTGDAVVGSTAKAEASSHDASHIADHGVEHGAEAPSAAAEIIYSNPLPHVLILTAIVVGVATTAVGLALAVRIREAYGTIEEDELEAIDNVAEFGDDAALAGGAS